MKAKALKFTKNHGFHGNGRISRNFTEMSVFHGRRPISRKMSRLWNRELGWSLPTVHTYSSEMWNIFWCDTLCPGDYRECSIVVWSTYTYTVLTSTKTSQPVHDIKWDPYTVNEFASVGEAGTLSFWLLDETQAEVTLSVHEAQLPDDLLRTHHMVCVWCPLSHELPCHTH